MSDPDTALVASTPLGRRWAEEAARDELRAVVQFAFLRRPLADLLLACHEASLELIVLKGAALAETVYPRPGLRSFGDIDLLVHLENASRAHSLLISLGYVVEEGVWADLLSGRECEANFFSDTERGPVVIELHTNLLNNALLRRQAHLDLAGLWRRSQPACLAGCAARVLGPEDQLLHLCLHLAGHYFEASNSLRDIVQVCAVQTVDWPLFLSLCRAADVMTLGYGGLFAAATLGGAAIPAFVLESLAPRRRRPLLESLVTAQVVKAEAGPTERQRFLLIWLLLDRPGARWQALSHLFFPSYTWLRAHYFYDLFDPPEADPAPLAISTARRSLGPALKRLPLGMLLYGRHGGYLLRQGMSALVELLQKLGGKRSFLA